MSKEAEIKVRSHFDAKTGETYTRFEIRVYETTEETITPLYSKQLDLPKTPNGLLPLSNLAAALIALADSITND